MCRLGGLVGGITLEFTGFEVVGCGPKSRGMLGKVPLAEVKWSLIVELMMLWTLRVSML